MGGSGGGTTTTTTNTYDPNYNAGMLAMQQEQQAWSREMFNMFKYGTTNPAAPAPAGTVSEMQYLQSLVNANAGLLGYQTAADRAYLQAQANIIPQEATARSQQLQLQQQLLPQEAGLRSAQIGAEQQVLPHQTTAAIQGYQLAQQLAPQEAGLRSAQIGAEQQILPHQAYTTIQQLQAQQQLTPLQTQAESNRLGLLPGYYNDAFKGVDVNQRMNEAQADVQHGFKNANEAARLDLQSYGLDPSSGRYAALNRSKTMAEAAGVAGARTQAKNIAEQEDFQRKTTGLQIR